ncbi:MAG: hypothetical protein FJ317_01225 [SAR202 cluster bacterium]|nr:hypothetical protein [SAR202 cluster bacterium]
MGRRFESYLRSQTRLALPVPFYSYILRNGDGRFYIGQTDDLALRLRRHNQDRSFSTKNRGPWEIVWWKAWEW